MSHPNPSHDKENEYPSDDFRSGSKKEPLSHAMHRINSKTKALKKMMAGIGKYNMPGKK